LEIVNEPLLNWQGHAIVSGIFKEIEWRVLKHALQLIFHQNLSPIPP
jgi:hypothetical protein